MPVPKMGFQYRASRKKEAKKRSKNSQGEDCVEVRYCDIPGMSKEVLRNMGNAKFRTVKVPEKKFKDLEERYPDPVASDNESIVSVDSDLSPNTNPNTTPLRNPESDPVCATGSRLAQAVVPAGEDQGEGRGEGKVHLVCVLEQYHQEVALQESFENNPEPEPASPPFNSSGEEAE